jgi:transposase
MYKWTEVKKLKAKGLGIKRIARELNLSKNTVKKYLKSSLPPVFKKTQKQSSLEEFRTEIENMFQNKFIGTRIYEELKKLGYEGSLSSVHRFIQSMRKTKEINTKRTTRFETKPGEQMQYDWSEWLLPVGNKKIKIYVHGLVLGFSRKKYYTYSLSISTKDVIRAIVSGIEYFNGFAKELLIDNPKQMILLHKKEVVRYNDEFLRFLGIYGIDSNPCLPRRARTKGKIERPFFYIKEQLLRGLKIEDISELEDIIADFTENYNAREHSTLKRPPNDMFEEEKERLISIPSVEPRIIYNMDLRKVSADGYVSWDGKLYPVPLKYCLSNVLIDSVMGKHIKIYDEKGLFIAEHNKNLFNERPIHPEHIKINEACILNRKNKRSKLLNRFIELTGETGSMFLEGLEKNTGLNVYWHVSEIINYIELYGIKNVLPAINICQESGFYDKNSVKSLIKTDIAIENFQNVLPLPVNIKRNLSYYRIEEK